MSELETAPPHELEAEQAVLGAAMAHTAAFERLRGAVTAGEFYRPAHELIWKALEVLYGREKPIDPMALMIELRETGELARAGGAPYLHTLLERGNTPAAWDAAQVVHETSRLRRLLQVHARMGQIIAETQGDHDAALSLLARETVNFEVIIDERTGDDPIEGLMHWSQAWSRYPSEEIQWLIPGLLVAEDVWMLLGGEGDGKSWLLRQLALCNAAGVHPLHSSQRIEPLRSVLVDLENAPSMVAYESRLVGHQVSRLGDFDDDLAYIVHREAGMNLRDPRAAMELERMVAQSAAQILIIGPLYKAFKRGRDDWDHAAEDVQAVIDRIRRRYGCAVVIEHHMPKAGNTGERALNPFGSSTWMRWPSLGHVVNQVGPNMWELHQFRKNRLERSIPAGLTRGGSLPWTPVWERSEVEAQAWVKPGRRKAATAATDPWEGQK